MKKVLALVLAVMMMATVAFAAGSVESDGSVLNPGSGSDNAGYGWKPGKSWTPCGPGAWDRLPGSPASAPRISGR